MLVVETRLPLGRFGASELWAIEEGETCVLVEYGDHQESDQSLDPVPSMCTV